MKPKLKISRVISLQDARYAAAKGFDFISFSMLRGDMRKLSAEMIWNMVNWVEGPQITIELDHVSLDEYEIAKSRFHIDRLLFPISDSYLDRNGLPSIIWKIPTRELSQFGETVNGLTGSVSSDTLFEYIADDLEILSSLRPIYSSLLLGFASLDLFESFVMKGGAKDLSPLGYTFGEEAEEEPGILDYQKMDEMLEMIGID